MAEPMSEKLVHSLQRINKALLEISLETVLSGPEVRDVSSSTKALWLGEEGMISAFRHSFNKLHIDEKQNTVDTYPLSQEGDKARVTVVEKLTEQKTSVEAEIEKLVEEQSLIESTIHNSIKCLDTSPSIREEESTIYI